VKRVHLQHPVGEASQHRLVQLQLNATIILANLTPLVLTKSSGNL
jgi:hypothetical protein